MNKTLIRNKRYIVLLVAFLMSLAVKFSYLQERRLLPDFSYPALDSKYNDDWAYGIATGKWEGEISSIRNEPFFRAPLYIYFLSTIYSIFGHSYYPALLVQIILGSISSLLLFRLAQKIFGFPTGCLAFFIYLSYWPLTYFEAELLIPALIIFLDLSLLLSLLWAGKKESVLPWLLPGLLLGLSALARPNVLIIIPFIIYWIYRRKALENRSLAFKAPLLLTLAIIVTIAPVTVRNVIVGKDLVFICSQGGVNFFIGNNPESNGVRAVVPGTRGDWWGGYHDTKTIAEKSLGHKLKASQISRYWYRRGLGFIFSDPISAGKLYMRKIILFLGNGEPSNNQQLYFKRDNSRILRLLIVNFSFILSLSIVGLILIIRERHSEGRGYDIARIERLLPYYFIVPYSISVVVFFITSRYRLPVSVLLIPSAAYGLYNIIKYFLNRQWRSVFFFMAIFLTFFAGSSHNPYGVGAMARSRGYYKLGVAYTHEDIRKALEAFSSSISCDSTYAPAWKMRGWTLSKLGDYENAIRDLRVACRLDSSFNDAYYTLAVVYQKIGLHDKAMPLYERVLMFEPNNKYVLNNIADIYVRKNEYKKAFHYLDKALKVDPEFENAIYGMAYYYEKTGDYDAAINEYKKILRMPAARTRIISIYCTTGKVAEARNILAQLKKRYANARDIAYLEEIILEYESER